MFTFYKNTSIVNFFKVYNLLLTSLNMDNHKYSIYFNFIETDEELELGNFIINIKDKKNKVIYQNCISTIYPRAKYLIQKIQLHFIENHHISLPYFTRNYKNEIDSYRIRNTKFELIQKLHFPHEIRNAEEIQAIALKKHYSDNVIENNIPNEFSKKDEIKCFSLLLSAVLEDLSQSSNQYFIYIDYKENKRNNCMGKFNVSIKDCHNNSIFYKDLYLNKLEASETTNQIRNNFIENHAISLPSVHRDELSDALYHHLRNTKFELIIHISNEIDYKNAMEAQEQALIKLQENYENQKIYAKKSSL